MMFKDIPFTNGKYSIDENGNKLLILKDSSGVDYALCFFKKVSINSYMFRRFGLTTIRQFSSDNSKSSTIQAPLLAETNSAISQIDFESMSLGSTQVLTRYTEFNSAVLAFK